MNAFGQAPESMLAPTSPGAMTMAAPSPSAKEIPYDYVARFRLRGESGNRVQDVINISSDGAFVAVAIGYSFIPAPPPASGLALVHTNLNTLNALFVSLRPIANLPEILVCLEARLCGIDFKYSIVDSGTGRELQNQPIHNVAGLGESAGFRPFRSLAKPVMYIPRSTIRIEVEEVSNGLPSGSAIYGYTDASGQRVGSELYIVLHGYKILNYGAGPQ
jgi:hypothetical protein